MTGTTSTKMKGMMIAAAVAGLFGAGAATPAVAKSGDEVKCEGLNACKGQSACAGMGHACAGKNGCKGHGSVKMSKEDCASKGGKAAPAPSAPMPKK